MVKDLESRTLFFGVFIFWLGIGPRASHMLGKRSATELSPSPVLGSCKMLIDLTRYKFFFVNCEMSQVAKVYYLISNVY